MQLIMLVTCCLWYKASTHLNVVFDLFTAPGLRPYTYLLVSPFAFPTGTSLGCLLVISSSCLFSRCVCTLPVSFLGLNEQPELWGAMRQSLVPLFQFHVFLLLPLLLLPLQEPVRLVNKSDMEDEAVAALRQELADRQLAALGVTPATASAPARGPEAEAEIEDAQASYAGHGAMVSAAQHDSCTSGLSKYSNINSGSGMAMW